MNDQINSSKTWLAERKKNWPRCACGGRTPIRGIECEECEKKSKAGFTTKAHRYNQGKSQWTLIDWASLEPLVRVLEF